MEIHELVIEMKLLERRLTLYEEKYGILSEDFYTALLAEGNWRAMTNMTRPVPISVDGRASTKPGNDANKPMVSSSNNAPSLMRSAISPYTNRERTSPPVTCGV